MQPIAGMLLNPFLHNQSFVNQLGNREKLTCFRAKIASFPIACTPSNRHSCFCIRAKPAHDYAKQPTPIYLPTYCRTKSRQPS